MSRLTQAVMLRWAVTGSDEAERTEMPCAVEAVQLGWALDVYVHGHRSPSLRVVGGSCGLRPTHRHVSQPCCHVQEKPPLYIRPI